MREWIPNRVFLCEFSGKWIPLLFWMRARRNVDSVQFCARGPFWVRAGGEMHSMAFGESRWEIARRRQLKNPTANSQTLNVRTYLILPTWANHLTVPAGANQLSTLPSESTTQPQILKDSIVNRVLSIDKPSRKSSTTQPMRLCKRCAFASFHLCKRCAVTSTSCRCAFASHAPVQFASDAPLQTTRLGKR